MSGSLDTLLAALAGARVYDLEQPRFFGAPNAPSHVPGYVYTLHRRHEPGASPDPRTSASGMVVSPEHAGTHIDALCHQAENLELFGGVAVTAEVQTPSGFTRHGIETVAPIITRGVLLDAARHAGVERLPELHLVGADDLRAAAREQGVEVRRGDVLLVRTGWGAVWEEPDTGPYIRGAGMDAGASEWAAELGVRAVGADNVAWDVYGAVDTRLGLSLPGHVILLVRHGVHIIEHLNLEELARDRILEFCFVCIPLKMKGATGSPVRPLALVPA